MRLPALTFRREKGETMMSLAKKVSPESTALVIVDVQNDFCARGGFFDKRGEDLSFIQATVPKIKSLISEARKAGVAVIFIQAVYDPEFVSPVMAEQRERKGITKLPLCLTGSSGVDFFEVSPLPSDIVVNKHRYSAFIGTDLDLILRSRAIKTLIMAGVATNVCVESTARDGYMHDYHIVFLEDCTATTDRELHAGTLENISRYFGQVCSSEEVTNIWKEHYKSR